MKRMINRIFGHGRTYRLLAPENQEAIDQYNQKNLSNLSLMGALMMLLPLISIPFSPSKRRLIPFYVAIIFVFIILYIVNRIPRMQRHALWGLYVGFSIFFALSVYLSVVHSPHMRATVLIGTFCIMPLAFIDNPKRMNLFVLFWFAMHTILAFYLKPLFALDDVINTLGFGLLGCFFGNLTTVIRVESYEAHRLLTIEKETDALTGLYNRRKLFDVIGGDQAPSGVLMIDIDHFKEYNDKHGHLAADRAMQSMAAILQRFEEERDFTFFRYGGEEFVGISYQDTEEELLEQAEQLRKLIEQAETQDPPITVSIGIACSTLENPLSSDSLIERADRAVFKAKDEGRNRVVAYRAP
jgi:diguanylate cyclase (GGDEF)-like protein